MAGGVLAEVAEGADAVRGGRGACGGWRERGAGGAEDAEVVLEARVEVVGEGGGQGGDGGRVRAGERGLVQVRAGEEAARGCPGRFRRRGAGAASRE